MPPRKVTSIPLSNIFEIFPLTKKPGFRCAGVTLKSSSSRFDSYWNCWTQSELLLWDRSSHFMTLEDAMTLLTTTVTSSPCLN